MTDLAARYGRTRTRSRRDRIIGWSVGIGILVTAVAWVWWVSQEPGSTDIQSRDLGYTVVDDTTVEVVFETTVAPGTAYSCGVQALNDSAGIVGWVELALEAPPERTQTHVVTVRTSERATTGVVAGCWLPVD